MTQVKNGAFSILGKFKISVPFLPIFPFVPLLSVPFLPKIIIIMTVRDNVQPDKVKLQPKIAQHWLNI